MATISQRLMEGGKPAFPECPLCVRRGGIRLLERPGPHGHAGGGRPSGRAEDVAPLAEKATFVKDNADVASGVTGMAAFGHSPGHMIYRLESEGQSLILTADTANHFVLSLQRPDWRRKFRHGQAKAAEKPQAGLRHDRHRPAGLHRLPHAVPAVGYVEKQGEGYRYNAGDLSVRALIYF